MKELVVLVFVTAHLSGWNARDESKQVHINACSWGKPLRTSHICGVAALEIGPDGEHERIILYLDPKPEGLKECPTGECFLSKYGDSLRSSARQSYLDWLATQGISVDEETIVPETVEQQAPFVGIAFLVSGVQTPETITPYGAYPSGVGFPVGLRLGVIGKKDGGEDDEIIDTIEVTFDRVASSSDKIQEEQRPLADIKAKGG